MSTKTDGTHPDIPEQKWTNPFPVGHPLEEIFGRRVRNEQDLVVVIDDYHARRGTGKTVAALQLAAGMNQAGTITKANVTTKPEVLRNAYAKLPQRSALVLDEGELGASKYNASSKANSALREIMSIGRVLEKYLIVTMPDRGMLDGDIWKLCDVWISMVEKGRGIVHFLQRNPYSGKIQTKKVGAISFKDIDRSSDLRQVYNALTREKKGHIDGDDATDYLTRSEVDQMLYEQRKDVRQETRNEVITDVYGRLSQLDDDDLSAVNRNSGVSQRLLAEAVGLSQPQIGNIVRGD